MDINTVSLMYSVMIKIPKQAMITMENKRKRMLFKKILRFGKLGLSISKKSLILRFNENKNAEHEKSKAPIPIASMKKLRCSMSMVFKNSMIPLISEIPT